MCTITNVIASSVVGPIATKVANTYNVSNAAVNSIAMIFRLVYTFVNFPANYIIDLNGLRVGVPYCLFS
jgi:fucose permease